MDGFYLWFLVVASLAAPMGLVLTGVLSLGDPSGAGRFTSLEGVIGGVLVYYLTKKRKRRRKP
jgi:membrane associated rhomboid family serine protease